MQRDGSSTGNGGGHSRRLNSGLAEMYELRRVRGCVVGYHHSATRLDEDVDVLKFAWGRGQISQRGERASTQLVHFVCRVITDDDVAGVGYRYGNEVRDAWTCPGKQPFDISWRNSEDSFIRAVHHHEHV